MIMLPKILKVLTVERKTPLEMMKTMNIKTKEDLEFLHSSITIKHLRKGQQVLKQLIYLTSTSLIGTPLLKRNQVKAQDLDQTLMQSNVKTREEF